MKYGGFPMKKDSVRFTVCIHKELFERLDYVSQFYGCSKSHELRRMIEREPVSYTHLTPEKIKNEDLKNI